MSSTLKISISGKMSSDSEREQQTYDADDGELDGFIVSDEETPNKAEGGHSENEEEEHEDKIMKMTSVLRPNETPVQKLLRAHISVLVSALGGPDHTSDEQHPPYRLGHDALACLKDIKRWMKSVDERNNTFDVSLACAESGLVVNDLTVILCQWERQRAARKEIKNDRTMEKIMLSCLELLVLLTWPTEMSEDMTASQKLSYEKVRKAQVVYKKHILSYQKGLTLKAVLRLGLSTLAKEKIDREPRENAILRLVLYFVRNVLYIEPPPTSVSTKSRKGVTSLDNMPIGVSMEDISLNTVMHIFKRTKVLAFLLTISASLGADLDRQVFGQTTLECIYLIFRRVEQIHLLRAQDKMQTQTKSPEERGSLEPELSIPNMQLKELMQKERSRKNLQTSSISTRHGRFGSLLSFQGSETSYVVSGQKALINNNTFLEKLDSTKKWNSRAQFKYDSDEYISNEKVVLTASSCFILKEFVESFLIGGCFNTLISSVSYVFSGSNDLEYIHEYEKACFFMLTAWFFKYKREKILYYEKNPSKLATITDEDDRPDYGSVGAGLGEVNFILLISYFRESFQLKRWNSLHVAMACFKELLLISYGVFSNKKSSEVVILSESQETIDRELAEGIIRKLFSFNDFLNIIIQLPQSASKHSPEYLRTAISIVHIMLKSFESFANEDIKVYVQSKRKKKKAASSLDKLTEASLRDVIDGSDDEFNDERVKEVTRERKLDFKATEAKFLQSSIISSHISFLSRYEDLEPDEIKKCLSYFHRVFFVRKDFNGLYRIDFLHLLFNLRHFFAQGSSMRDQVDQFIYYFMKKFKSAFARFPNPIEIMMTRFEDLTYKSYLATGDLYLKPESADRKLSPKLAKGLEFVRDNFTKDEKFKILVSILFRQEKHQLLDWLVSDLKRILDSRLLDENYKGILNANTAFQRLIINNPYLRLLLSLIGFDLPFILDEKCELTSIINNDLLAESTELLKNWISKQPVSFEEGKDPEYFLRTGDSYEYDNDDDYNEVDDPRLGDGDESIAFETEAKTNGNRRNLYELDELDQLEASMDSKKGNSNRPKGVAKKKGLSKSSKNDKETKRKSRKIRGQNRKPFNLLDGDEKNISHKSSEYVRDSDDESGNEEEIEFYQREERLRELLKTAGGIVNSAQLEAFKQAWGELEGKRGHENRENVFAKIKAMNLNDFQSAENLIENEAGSQSVILQQSDNDSETSNSFNSEQGNFHDSSEESDIDQSQNTQSFKTMKRVLENHNSDPYVDTGYENEESNDFNNQEIPSKDAALTANQSIPPKVKKRKIILSDNEDNYSS